MRAFLACTIAPAATRACSCVECCGRNAGVRPPKSDGRTRRAASLADNLNCFSGEYDGNECAALRMGRRVRYDSEARVLSSPAFDP